MLADSLNSELYAQWINFIDDGDVKRAFRYIVGAAACSRTYTCHPQLKGKSGPVKDFRFINSSGEQPFSFITNKKWLLFYFRPPAQRSGAFDQSEIESQFSSFNANPAGEWTVRLASFDDAFKLCDVIGL